MKQDFNNAEKLLNLAKKTDILKLQYSFDGELKIDFQYFKEIKGWPARGYKVRKSGDKKWASERIAEEHEIVGYLSQFKLIEEN